MVTVHPGFPAHPAQPQFPPVPEERAVHKAMSILQ